jgi:hypothetical protein
MESRRIWFSVGTPVDEALGRASALSGKTLLTCSLPMSEDDSHLVIGHTSSGAEILAANASEGIGRTRTMCGYFDWASSANSDLLMATHFLRTVWD